MVFYLRDLSQFRPPARLSCAWALQVTHLLYSSTGGSGEDLSLFSSSKLPVNIWRKWLTSGPNSGRSSRSESKRGSLASLFSPDPRPLWGGLYLKKGAGPSSGCTLWCLQFHPLDLLLWQTQLQEWTQTSSQPQVVDQLSHSISSSKAAAVATALQWASLTLAMSPSAEVSLLPLLGVLLLGGWMSDWTWFLYPLQRLALFPPQVVFEGGHYLCGQFLLSSQPPWWGPW